MIEEWVDEALSEAAEAATEKLDADDREIPLGVLLKLREHKAGIAAVGELGLARMALHTAAGDAASVQLELLRAKNHRGRRAVRRRARLRAHAEREQRDAILDGLLEAFQDIGAFAMTQALPYLLRELDLGGLEL